MEQALINCDGLGCDICRLIETLTNVISFLLFVSFAVTLLFAIIAGFLYIFSLGNEKKIKLAKNGFKYSLIGFFVCLTSYLAVNIVYRTLGYGGESWSKIECVEESSVVEKSVTADPLYKNEILADELGGRSKPILLNELPQLVSEYIQNKYFFIRGLGAQPVSKSVSDFEKIIKEVVENNGSLYAVLPRNSSLESDEIDSRLVNLNNLLSSNSEETKGRIQKLINQIATESPSSEIPLIATGAGEAPAIFNNIWPDAGDLSPIVNLVDGVVYEENTKPSKAESSDDSSFTINLNYDEKKDTYSLDPEKPVSLNFDPNVNKKAAEEVADQIADVIVGSLSGNNNSNAYPTISNLLGNMENPSIGSLPDGLIKTVGGDNITQEEVKNLENSIGIKIAEAQNFSLSNAPKAPENPVVSPPVSTKNPSSTETTPPIPSASELPTQYSSSLSPSSIAENISRVGGYDVSGLNKRVSTDRVLTTEERKDLNKMLKGFQQEMADNGENMNIPTEAMMCVFEKESGFDGGARSETGCSGIGQICMAESQMAINHMKKYAPEHFKAFSDKFEKDGKGNIDQVFNASRNSGKNNEKRRELLRSDPNFGAAMAYALMDYKKKGGENGKGKPIGNDRDLQRLINSYGPGDSGYADSIMGCMKNNRWLVDRRKKK